MPPSESINARLARKCFRVGWKLAVFLIVIYGFSMLVHWVSQPSGAETLFWIIAGISIIIVLLTFRDHELKWLTKGALFPAIAFSLILTCFRFTLFSIRPIIIISGFLGTVFAECVVMLSVFSNSQVKLSSRILNVIAFCSPIICGVLSFLAALGKPHSFGHFTFEFGFMLSIIASAINILMHS